MNSHSSYLEPMSQITDNSNHNKKYSLRRKYQNPMRQQPTHNATFLYPNPHPPNQHLHTIAHKQQQLLNSTANNEAFNFNCMDSAQKILDFNQATSLNIKNTHSKTLSTTPSFENPFAHPNPNTKHPRVTKDDFSHPDILSKNSLASSKEDLLAKKTKSQKTSTSHKFTHNTNQRLYTQSISQLPNLLPIRSQDIDKRTKISLKNTWKLNTQPKPQFLICLKYSDLKEPISSMHKNRLSFNNSQIDYGHRQDNGSPFTKYICSTIKGSHEGCQCQPKCVWIDRWTNLIADKQIQSVQTPLNEQNWSATVKQIEKDLPRTQPQHKTFQSPEYIQSLREVLLGYAKLDPQVGYVQGMNFIAAALIYHSKASYQALRIMQYIMKGSGFRKILLKDLAMSHLVTKRCMYQLKRLAYDLYSHFIHEEVQIEIFITSWYFSMFGNFVPLESMHLVLDKFISKQFTGLNEIIITLLIYMKGTLLTLQDNSLMMAFSTQQITKTASGIDWADLIDRSNNLLLQPFLY